MYRLPIERITSILGKYKALDPPPPIGGGEQTGDRQADIWIIERLI